MTYRWPMTQDPPHCQENKFSRFSIYKQVPKIRAHHLSVFYSCRQIHRFKASRDETYLLIFIQANQITSVWFQASLLLFIITKEMANIVLLTGWCLILNKLIFILFLYIVMFSTDIMSMKLQRLFNWLRVHTKKRDSCNALLHILLCLVWSCKDCSTD